MKWIDSCGGPLLLLPERLLPQWFGIEPPPDGRKIETRKRWDPDGPATDYDRACEIEGYLGNLDVGAGSGLVIGDEPLVTTFLPQPRGGLIVRWSHAASEPEIRAAAEAMAAEAEVEDTGFLRWEEGPLVLFDSATPGNEVEEDRLTLDLAPGTYAADAICRALDEATTAVIVRLTRHDG